MAIRTVHRKSGQTLNFSIMHGASTDHNRGPDSLLQEGCFSFCAQLEAAAAWCAEHDGALLMDANRIPCIAWRSPAAPMLSRGDKALRALVGWHCTCCSPSDEEVVGGACFIGAQFNESGKSPR